MGRTATISADSTLPVKSRPPTYQRHIARTRDERPVPASRTEFGVESFLWKPGERVDGPPRVTRVHFVSETMNDRES
jgi:hypothetical protein